MLKALPTNYFRPFPGLRCGCTPTVYLEHVCVLLSSFLSSVNFCFIYFFLVCLPLCILGFYISSSEYFFLHILTGWRFKFSMECYIPVFFSCVCVSFRVSSAEICCCFLVDIFTVFHVCCLRFWCCAHSLLLTWSDYSTSTHALTHGPGRLVGVLYLISLSFLLDSWFSPLLSLHYRVAKHMYPSIWCTHCQRLCSSQADHFPTWGLTH